MTRETKMGLLAGVGFIVVFAIMLAHFSKAPPAGDGLPQVLVHKKTETPPSSTAVAARRPAQPAPAVETPVNPPADRGLGSSELVLDDHHQAPPSSETDLPSPLALEGAKDPSIERIGLVSSGDPELNTREDSGAVLIHPVRKAPPPLEPRATVRPKPPVESTLPSAEPAPTTPGSPSPARPSTDEPPIKNYVVQKGDTINAIAEKLYGTSKPKVVDVLLQANKIAVKNKHRVIEGQKLVIPALPPDQFEPAPGFNVHLAEAPVKAEFTSPESASPGPPVGPEARKAPKPAAPESSTTRPSGVAGKNGFRVYVVQPKDTLSSIAKDQLGSKSQWQDIANLNKGMDPKKIKPGMEIRVPVKRAGVRSNAEGQVSA